MRELQNVIERAAIASQGRALQFVLPNDDRIDNSQPITIFDAQLDDKWVVVHEPEMRQRERQNIIAALKKCNGKIYGTGGAAQLLDIKLTTLSSRIKKLKIEKQMDA